MPTANPFIKTRNQFGRDEQYLDRKAFGTALGEALGMPVEFKDDDSPVYAYVTIDAGDELVIHVGSGAWNLKLGRVEIRAFAAGERDILDHHEVSKLPSITVDTARPIEALARDVKRRLIEPSRPLVEAGKERIAAGLAKTNALEKRVTELEAKFPGISITPDSRKQTAEVYVNRGGAYLTGTLWPDGHINFQRVSLETAEQAETLIALAFGKPTHK